VLYGCIECVNVRRGKLGGRDIDCCGVASGFGGEGAQVPMRRQLRNPSVHVGHVPGNASQRGGLAMNDRAAGAIEALAWILNLLERNPAPERLRSQVEAARDDLLQGVSVDFRERIRNRL
jgi:hypothetical protein